MAIEIIMVRVTVGWQPNYSIKSSEYDYLVEDYLKYFTSDFAAKYCVPDRELHNL